MRGSRGWTSVKTSKGRVVLMDAPEVVVDTSGPTKLAKKDFGAPDSAKVFLQAGEKYRALGKAKMREDVRLNSEEVLLLTPGQVVTLYETKEYEGHLRGLVEVNGYRGWTSVTTQNGRTVLEKC